MHKSPAATAASTAVSRAKAAATASAKDSQGRATRETIESIAVAVILAFLFRAFVAEAFVIPTGSMAPTLQGRHMDVCCVKCQYQYRTSASVENDRSAQVVATSCPICGYTMELDKTRYPNQRSFNGDRILVSKFAYEVADPQRWDVIVFKYPGNAKQNYIKRLVGLPNETLRIRHGDIYTRPLGEDAPAEFQIARKPPYKLRAMLQLVHDTRYEAPELQAAGWPRRWQDWRSPQSPAWQAKADDSGFETQGGIGSVAWLRYRHVFPWDTDWQEIEEGKTPAAVHDAGMQGQLISDYYAYNDGVESAGGYGRMIRRRAWGTNWVGDLALEADVELDGNQGHLLLDLVEGGVHYTCRIDVASGEAQLSIDGGQRSFRGEDGQAVAHAKAPTGLRGGGKHRVMLSNCDDQLLLWVDGRLAVFDGPTTYVPQGDVKPQWSPEEAGDLEPAGIGAEGVGASVSRLRLYRDVYYVSSTHQTRTPTDYEEYFNDEDVLEVFATPQAWNSTPLFDARRKFVDFPLGQDQFFPLGDNSPQSRDGRLWSQGDPAGLGRSPPPYVRRDLLTGKALVIYWPHSWRRPIPFFPNFQRMGLIR